MPKSILSFSKAVLPLPPEWVTSHVARWYDWTEVAHVPTQNLEYADCLKQLLWQLYLDKDCQANYIHIYNLNNIYKLLECLFPVHLQGHLISSPNLAPFNLFIINIIQLRLLSLAHLYQLMHSAKASLLDSLDSSAEFNTVDQCCISCLDSIHHFNSDSAPVWTFSYLKDHSQKFH